MKQHNLLKRQLKKTIGDLEDYPEEVRSLLEMVNNAYHDFDEDRNLLERSLEITSKELVDRYERLKEDNEKLIKTREDLQEKEKKLEASLREKEVLLVEIHHRVKNNLAAITGMLYLQMDMEPNEQLRIKLREAQHRIQSMAMIHEMLYKSESLYSIRIDKYLSQLVHSIVDNFKDRGQQIDIDIDAKNLLLDIETAIPIALLVNEIVTNSLKYAFPGKEEGLIEVKLVNGSDHQIQLVIADNGVGIAENIDLECPDSLGFLLIQTFVQQLNGTMEIDGTKGTTFRFTIPLSELLRQRDIATVKRLWIQD